jgi:hypothetical protein
MWTAMSSFLVIAIYRFQSIDLHDDFKPRGWLRRLPNAAVGAPLVLPVHNRT